ncbi:glycosyltransferase family 2 protein [Candidatus Venteria ishoeyi]|uniref:glycosyltransferase family 2 protein n=1 Tax=Candidatus Venteria ishoeyi TaxID=1899563 RepID=UPI0025A636A2|nr:glycosyltransferase family 2 protein [Candidatus Venteria ishoeyi]MDM8547134.1 glycosyltransferase family 2 protein [Candidatus Venteria ishoeyi]
MNHILSVIVPTYNEADVIATFHQRITRVMQQLNCEYEIIYIDDGSEDETLFLLNQLREQDPCISIVDLSRNFGKEIAMSAGLDHCIGDAVIVIDADLQDPPELIPALIDEWKNGYDVVYAQRKKRHGETWLKTKSATLFYQLLWKISRVKIPKDTGDFRLLSRRAVDALKTLNEHHRYMKGLFAWIGYPQKAVMYDRDPRASGETKWSYWYLWNFAIEGITSFSDMPLKISTYIGTIAASGSFLYGIYMIIRTLIFDNPISGYPSIIVIILFLGGIQLISLGVIGEYLGRTYDESKRRTLYFTKGFHPSLVYKDKDKK